MSRLQMPNSYLVCTRDPADRIKIQHFIFMGALVAQRQILYSFRAQLCAICNKRGAHYMKVELLYSRLTFNEWKCQFCPAVIPKRIGFATVWFSILLAIHQYQITIVFTHRYFLQSLKGVIRPQQTGIQSIRKKEDVLWIIKIGGGGGWVSLISGLGHYLWRTKDSVLFFSGNFVWGLVRILHNKVNTCRVGDDLDRFIKNISRLSRQTYSPRILYKFVCPLAQLGKWILEVLAQSQHQLTCSYLPHLKMCTMSLAHMGK